MGREVRLVCNWAGEQGPGMKGLVGQFEFQLVPQGNGKAPKEFKLGNDML